MPYLRNIWQGKFLANHAGKWQTMQAKAIGKENLVNKLQLGHMPNTFSVYL